MIDKFYVYILFRPWDGSPCYVGKGHGNRWRHFSKNRNPHLRNIIAKAGGEVPHVKIRQNLAEDEAFSIERAFIKAIGRGDVGPLVNMTDGGDGVAGLIVSAETRRKMRDAHLGRIFSEEHKAKLRVKNSDETRRRKSLSATGRILPPEVREKLRTAASKRIYSMETRAKMRAAKLGRVFSAETRAKMREAQNFRRLKERQSSAGEKTWPQEVGSGSSSWFVSSLDCGETTHGGKLPLGGHLAA